ncbi:MAG: hypothetical protein E7D55_16935, partial [Acinetobacter junii]|nr:hypothetical protein [Acinetobacter junii]
QKKLSKCCCLSLYIFMATFIGLIMNSKCQQTLVKNKENQALMKRPYLLIDESGNIQKGVTDRNGFMNLKTTASAQSLTTRVMVNEIEEAEEDGNAEE